MNTCHQCARAFTPKRGQWAQRYCGAVCSSAARVAGRGGRRADDADQQAYVAAREARGAEMEARYQAGASMRAIAAAFGVSHERVRQILVRRGVRSRAA